MTVNKINGITIEAATLGGSSLATITTLMDTKIADKLVLKRKSADQTVNNSEALVNVTDLVLAVGVDEVWQIELMIFTQSASGTPDVDYAFSVPSNGVIRKVKYWESETASGFLNGVSEETLAGVDSTEKSSGTRYVYIGGDTAGNVQLQFAQHVATVEDTKLKANSSMICRKLV